MDISTYEAQNRATLDRRIAWWREAKFGLFIHYGIYSCYQRGEWIKLREGISQEEYIRTADTQMTYKPGTAEEWARCAVDAGMKYAILTAQHHDGFSLWASRVNPYNSVNYGPRVDIVREFCEACRKYDLKIGLYYSLINWEHPDGGRCATDEEARELMSAFSRGGFTDAYFEGHPERHSMLGVRSEEDKAETRSREELSFSPKKIRAWARVSIKAGERATMTLYTRDKEASASGDIPREAISSPLSGADVKARLSRMGNTFLELSVDDIELSLDEGLNLSPGSLNAQRRAAADARIDAAKKK